MVHLSGLIRDLGLILATAGAVTLLFRRLRQPVVLGYIVAGILVGPHVSFFLTVSDLRAVQVWAEIGVIFLLFGLGLDFSFKKLLRIGHAASVTALVEVGLMTTLGFCVGRALGWTAMDSLFLGGILCISSTTIIIRAFEEARIKEQRFAGLVFGVLIVEDLVAILLLAVLSTIALTQKVSGVDLVQSVLRLGFFVLLWFVGGIFMVPLLLKRLRGFLSNEALVILSLALCFAMVILAHGVGFSPALGAFVMGSILAETAECERIRDLTHPIRDLFAAIFFVSVGMLLEPRFLIEYAWPIALLCGVTVIGKIGSTSLGALLAGQNLRTSIQSGFSLAQIGEFSFIIAGLGLHLKVTQAYLFPIAVAVCVVTTFTTPYLIRLADPVYERINRWLPKRWGDAMTQYEALVQRLTLQQEQPGWIGAHLTPILLNALVIAAIFLVTLKQLRPWVSTHVGADWLSEAFTLGVGLVLASPFLWALGFQRTTEKSTKDGGEGRLLRFMVLVVEILRRVMALTLVGFFVSRFVFPGYVIVAWILVLGVLIFVWKRSLQAVYGGLERQFLSNLQALPRRPLKPALAPWDAHLTVLRVSPEAPCVGRTLAEIGIRERYGVTIAFIERGNLRIGPPGRHDRLFPHDEITLIGTDEQLARFRALIEKPILGGQGLLPEEELKLHSFVLNGQSPFSFKTILESGIREQTKGLVVGVERQGKRFLNPDSTFRLEPDDTVWLVAPGDLAENLPSVKI